MISDRASAISTVNTMSSTSSSLMHQAVEHVAEAGRSSYKGHHRRHHWWNSDCLTARDRRRFWLKLWNSCGRPREGHTYTCYKLAKKTYRHACRTATCMNTVVSQTFKCLDMYYGSHRMNKFWNLVKRSKSSSVSCTDDIELSTLRDYYTNKFSKSDDNMNMSCGCANSEVEAHYNNIEKTTYSDFHISESQLLRHIRKLRQGCAAGIDIDGITAEHIKWASRSNVIHYMCSMLTLCIRFGVVPDSFTKGLLMPILKKPNIDPSVPKNYRPIVISTTFAKLLEVHILHECGEHEFHDLQFGFIESRGTAMAATLAHDSIDHCKHSGSHVYVCSLDAEVAFDSIPHCILFRKAMGVISNKYWRILVYWYRRLVVHIKWNNILSDMIHIHKGTRQGGLSSPFLFNLLYQDMMEELSQMNCGISMGHMTFNACCYADDVILCSVTVTGLQSLIDTANTYITNHGLRFNPSKSMCITFGNSSFRSKKWNIHDEQLSRKRHYCLSRSNII